MSHALMSYRGFVISPSLACQALRFAPYSASVIGLYEVASNNFQIVDISSKLAGGMKFSGAAESGGKASPSSKVCVCVCATSAY